MRLEPLTGFRPAAAELVARSCDRLLVLLLLAALTTIPAGAIAGEAEDLADAYLAAGKPREAVEFYRKAIARQPSADGLWEKYDKALEAWLLSQGRVVRTPPPAAPSPAAETLSRPSLPALTAPPAPSAAAVPPAAATSTPSPGVQAPAPTPAEAERGPLSYRPGERVLLPEARRAAGAPSLPVIDGDRFRIEELEISYTGTGSVKVTGRVSNSGSEPLNRPVIYVGIYDKQQSMVGRGRAYLAHGTYFLPPGASEEFTVGFPTYTGPVSAYSVELVGGH